MGQGKTGGSAGGQGGSAGSSDPFMSFLFGSNWNGGGTSQVGTNPTTTGMTSSPTGLPTTQPTPTTNPFASPSLTSLMGTVLGGTALNNVNWKCLCEFYNVNYAQAQGIIRNSIGLATQMLVPDGLCVFADITNRPTNHNFEYFSMILNKESNEHDSDDSTIARTILPVPCARNSRTCHDSKCFTQRIFEVNHRLAHKDISKISYRVLAPTAFALNITDSFTRQGAFNVNAHRPHSSCLKSNKALIMGEISSGYTNFFE